MEKMMSKMQWFGALLLIAMLVAGNALATDIYVGISGPGAVNDSTIKAGEKVSVDIYWSNDIDDLRGFATGFKILSEDIKNVIHVADSGNGLNAGGDIKGHNGWQNSEVWDFSGVMDVPLNWDGALPDTVGFGGFVIKHHYGPHEKIKVLSWDIIVPDPGTLVVDSSFFPPGGKWSIVHTERTEVPPVWHGPYKFTVVK